MLIPLTRWIHRACCIIPMPRESPQIHARLLWIQALTILTVYYTYICTLYILYTIHMYTIHMCTIHTVHYTYVHYTYVHYTYCTLYILYTIHMYRGPATVDLGKLLSCEIRKYTSLHPHLSLIMRNGHVKSA